MTIQYHVRRVNLDDATTTFDVDLVQLAALYDEFGKWYMPTMRATYDDIRMPTCTYERSWVYGYQSPAHLAAIYVAENIATGELIGMVMVTEDVLYRHGRMISNLYVKPGYRGMRCGTMLMMQLMDDDSKRHPHVDRYLLSTDIRGGINSTVSWYEKLGFFSQEVVMHKLTAKGPEDAIHPPQIGHP